MKIILIISIVIFLFGCNGTNCISVGGTWKDMQGNIQYCFDSNSSASSSRPILSNSESAEKAVLFTEDDVKKIEASLNTQPSTKNLEKKDLKERVKKIIDIINR